MKTFEVERLSKKSDRYLCTEKRIKLKVGMVFEMTGDAELCGTYIITEQKKVNCNRCPFASLVPRYGLHVCRLFKVSKSGCLHQFCKKDLRGSAHGDNAFTIKKLDTIMEGL